MKSAPRQEVDGDEYNVTRKFVKIMYPEAPDWLVFFQARPMIRTCDL